MKRKLIFASFMLIFALVAVVASTYAWFTMQLEAEVGEMDLNVVSGDELQIATEASGPFGYSVTVPTIEGSLDTVTYINGEFKTIAYNEDLGQYEYTNAYAFGEIENEDGHYLTYDLYFKSTVNDKTLFLNMTDSTFVSNQEDVEDFLRVAFVFEGGNGQITEQVTKILEPSVGNGQYGVGPFFDINNNAPLELFSQFLEDPDADGIYTFKDGASNEYQTHVDGDLDLVQLPAGEEVHVKVIIWLEGWDGDAQNVLPDTTLETYLKFGLK